MGKCYSADDSWEGAPERSATAGPYFAAHNLEPASLCGRSRRQAEAVSFAIHDMVRLYSHRGCEVIVLPTLDLDTFPGGNVWGIVNRSPYQNRGWCFAEFSIALYSHRHQPA